MAAPEPDAPCDLWATEADLCSPCDDYSLDAGLLDQALEAASSILYKLSGRQYSTECRETVIVGEACGCAISGPLIWQSIRRNRRRLLDQVCRHDRMKLRGYPIREIHSVEIDGETIDASEYRVEEYQDLVRIDAIWPQEVVVDYSYGADPPPEGVKAAAVLACELMLACQPEGAAGRSKCRLPRRVVSLVRQGVSLTFPDPFEFLDKGRTGIIEIDLFLATVNPDDNRSRPAIYSPDLPSRGRRIT